MSVSPEERLPAVRVVSHFVVMVAVAAVMGVVAAGLALPFAGVAGLGASSVAEGIEKLPAELEANPLPQKTEIVDGAGNLIATVYDENRVNVRLDQVSRIMVKAILAIEDYRFYQHGALDMRGTLRALITNQASDGVVQGGSSITQQMVKLTLISQARTKDELRAATDDTYARKIRELRYAIAFEEKFSKDWILERYLNIAYFGDGAYGIQAAAQHYFDKNASALTLREAAMLAGLVKNPTGYDPTNSPDRAVERRNVVLQRMAELDVISGRQARRAKNSSLGLNPTKTYNGCVNSRAPFFCDYVMNYLLADRALGRTVEQRRELIETGGLTIRTTIDTRFQQAADRSVRAHVYPRDNAIGGLAMVEPRTGEVKAIAQSRPMGSDKSRGQTYLNYAVNQAYGDSQGFQGGSTFKAFVLASAITQGIPLNSNIEAPQDLTISETRYRDCGGQPYGYGTWELSNSTGAGTRNLITGTRESVNTFFAKLEAQTGLCAPFRLARRIGLDLTNPEGDRYGNGAERVPSFTLGSPNVSPLEMAEAYATFAGRGLHCEARPVTVIEDANGDVLREYPARCAQVLRPEVADGVNYVLRGVQEPGGFGYLRGITIPQVSAGKTGTTQEGKAVWFVGYTPNLAAASMIAGANYVGQPMGLDYQSVGGSVIYGASGSSVAGPMWSDAMDVVAQWLPDLDFVDPPVEIIRGVPTDVPDVAGMSVPQAVGTLRAAGFRVDVGPLVDSAYTEGTVAYSLPAAGARAGRGSIVIVYISDGTPPPKPPRGGGGNGGRGGGGGGGGNGGGGNNGGGGGGNGGGGGGGNGGGGGGRG